MMCLLYHRPCPSSLASGVLLQHPSCNANMHGVKARQGCEWHKNEQDAAVPQISLSFRLLCAPSRQWPAAESRGPESGWPQNLAAEGRVACDFNACACARAL
ncbi:hypothetical protein TRIATDRAFT_299310 [Trichoderma atroviride IMI 206040]|uniref:Uncharacterized protein n=1 Tax=Hypocrea atroviridis (strain ATCC 20476 / IMI 206040) TaxID=452589 RepID=G9NU58_HYPAI|nr:uncharacterized protein TRIATDRAFT_299310 [Trichoderma atroviride IMI 206040]EHK45591.1 hypothetical protein TRIATDRAFT_299310 [Trichoderma atroviride IMI 206040]